MRMIQSVYYNFKNILTIDDKLIVILAMSLFLPYVITILTFVLIGSYVLVKSDFKSNLQVIKGAYILCAFAIYLMVVSVVVKNYLGLTVSVGMLFMFIVIIYYRKYIHQDLFEIILDVMIVMSLVSVVYAVFEQFYYMQTLSSMHGFFDIQNKPQYRVHTFFSNANYYAMMITFVEAILVYKFMKLKQFKLRMYYVVAGLLNLFALFLTGGRIAWLCLAIGILVMLVVSRWYKTLFAVLGTISISGFILSRKPGLIPRLAAKGLSLERREYIYQTAQMMIRDTWLFGRGPLAYYHNYHNYYAEYVAKYGDKHLPKLGISAPHAHSILFEPLISFGLIGSIMFFGYIGLQVQCAYRLIRRKVDILLASLIFGFISITLSFSIIDFPIYWVQTAGLFFIILGSSNMYKKDVE